MCYYPAKHVGWCTPAPALFPLTAPEQLHTVPLAPPCAYRPDHVFAFFTPRSTDYGITAMKLYGEQTGVVAPFTAGGFRGKKRKRVSQPALPASQQQTEKQKREKHLLLLLTPRRRPALAGLLPRPTTTLDKNPLYEPWPGVHFPLKKKAPRGRWMRFPHRTAPNRAALWAIKHVYQCVPLEVARGYPSGPVTAVVLAGIKEGK